MATVKEKDLLEQIKKLSKELEKERLTRREVNSEQYKIDTVAIVSNRLPVTLKKNPSTKQWETSMGSGGLVSAMSSLKLNMKWIGWVGMDVQPEDKNEINKILSKINCVPVYLPKELLDAYYNGFSNDILWPILHYVQLPIKTLTSEKEYWYAYEEVNRRFCSVVLENSSENEIIWVQDYHLMVLPYFLRKAYSRSKIGWFLHTPFPNSDIYRTLSHRVELLKGVLACDLVGFHIYNYVRNFKNSCAEILGCEVSADAIEYNSKLTIVDAFPIGIDIEKFERAKTTEFFRSSVKNLRKRYGDVKIIICVDRLDYIKGIMHKLVALEHFFESNKNWIDKVTYVQIAVPTRTEVLEYQKLAENVHELVGRINGKFSNLTHVPIHYLDQCVDFDTLVALYNIADVCLITSLRDGMNLVSYEYVASQTEDVGVLILSEFVGAAQSLGAGCIQINPWNIEEVSDAIKLALNMSKEEKERLFNYGKQYITDHSSQRWAEDFLLTLNHSWKIANLVYEEPTLPIHVDFRRMQKIYSNSKRRLIICGLFGTLTKIDSLNMKFNDFLEYMTLSDTTIESLKLLSEDKKTQIIIATSRTKAFAEKMLSSVPVIICAENGFYLKDNSISSEWIKTAEPVNLSWMDPVERIMQYFVERTPNSFMERFDASLNWHYSDCIDPFSEKQARDMINNLQTGPLLNLPVEVVHEKQNKFVKVRMTAFNKISAITRAVEYIKLAREIGGPEKLPPTSFLPIAEMASIASKPLQLAAAESCFSEIGSCAATKACGEDAQTKAESEKKKRPKERGAGKAKSKRIIKRAGGEAAATAKSVEAEKREGALRLSDAAGDMMAGESAEKASEKENVSNRQTSEVSGSPASTLDFGQNSKEKKAYASPSVSEHEGASEEEALNPILRSVREYDFVLCIGSYFDTDQEVFSALNDKVSSCQRGQLSESQVRKISESDGTDNQKTEPTAIFTISVGKRKSLAKEYLKNSSEVEQLLRYLSKSELN